MRASEIDKIKIYSNEYSSFMHLLQSLDAESIEKILDLLLATNNNYSLLDLNSFICSSDYADLLRKTINTDIDIRAKSEKYNKFRKNTGNNISYEFNNKDTYLRSDRLKQLLNTHDDNSLETAYKEYLTSKINADSNNANNIIFFLNNHIPLQYEDQILTERDRQFAKENNIDDVMMKKFKQLEAMYIKESGNQGAGK